MCVQPKDKLLLKWVNVQIQKMYDKFHFSVQILMKITLFFRILAFCPFFGIDVIITILECWFAVQLPNFYIKKLTYVICDD